MLWAIALGACGGQSIQAIAPIQAPAVIVQPSPKAADVSPTPGVVNPPVPVTYNEAKGLLAIHCVKCHGPGGQKSDVTFDSLEKVIAAKVEILKRIKDSNGLGPMPPKASQGPEWPDDRKKILGWLEKYDGASTPLPTPTEEPSASGVYIGEIKTILDTACASCHKASGMPGASDYPMETFAQVKQARSGIVVAIESGSMPKYQSTWKTTAEGAKVLKWLKAPGELKEQ